MAEQTIVNKKADSFEKYLKDIDKRNMCCYYKCMAISTSALIIGKPCKKRKEE